MKNKDNFVYLFCTGLSILMFVFFAIPYVTWKYQTIISVSGNINGYKIMNLWDYGFGGIMSSLTQLFILLMGIVLLIIGIIGILKMLDVLKNVPDQIGKFSLSKIASFAIILYAILNVLMLLFLIIFVASNDGYGLNAGIFVNLVFIIASVVGIIFLQKGQINE